MAADTDHSHITFNAAHLLIHTLPDQIFAFRQSNRVLVFLFCCHTGVWTVHIFSPVTQVEAQAVNMKVLPWL